MTDVRFYWIDVFAKEALTGNPLALVPDGDALSLTTMRALAREFNQSETTFLVSPSRPSADYRLRSFTPGGVEVLGAGHNAMGAWLWLAASGQLPLDRTEFFQQIGDDVLPVVVDVDSSPATVTMTQSPPRFLAEALPSSEMASALGVLLTDLSSLPAVVASTGAEHLLVPLTSSEAVDRAVPKPAVLKELLARHGAEGCYIYATEGIVNGIDAYARFFNPTVGIAEDPATGTAAGPLAALLVRDGRGGSGGEIMIEQGRAMGRPSILRVRVVGDRVELSGSGVVVAEGVLHL